jgi:hypothetical protein
MRMQEWLVGRPLEQVDYDVRTGGWRDLSPLDDPIDHHELFVPTVPVSCLHHISANSESRWTPLSADSQHGISVRGSPGRIACLDRGRIGNRDGSHLAGLRSSGPIPDSTRKIVVLRESETRR